MGRREGGGKGKGGGSEEMEINFENKYLFLSSLQTLPIRGFRVEGIRTCYTKICHFGILIILTESN